MMRITSRFLKTAPLYAVVLVTFLYVVLLVGLKVASAERTPLDSPGCFNQSGLEYTRTTCIEDFSKLVNPPYNKCFLLNRNNGRQGVVVNKEINCKTGDLTNKLSEKSKCVVSGGTWEQVGGQGEGAQGFTCRCDQKGYEYSSDTKGCINTEKKECEEAGGKLEWVGSADNGSQICVCPEGQTMESGVCITSEETTEETGGEEVIKTDCKVSSEVESLSSENCGIVRLLVSSINVLSAIAGMAIVGSMMWAGYLYMTARDNSGQVEAAKKRILWAGVALLLFIFMYAFLNWLVPGGVL